MEVHRCRFVEYQPAAINALDFTPSTVKDTRLAVGRANGNIEIWDPTYNYRLQKTLPGGEDLSVESLAWAHQNTVVNPDEDDTPEDILKETELLLQKPPRLFSSGLNPFIIEWDTTTMTAKVKKKNNYLFHIKGGRKNENINIVVVVEIMRFQRWCSLVFSCQ